MKGVQSRTAGDHCSFRPLHLLSPFPSTQAHSFQPKTTSSPSWPTFHLHFFGPNRIPIQQPIFLFFSFLPHLPITSLFLLPCYQPHLPITFPFFLSLFPATNSLEDPSFGYKSHQKKRRRVVHLVKKKVD